MYGPERRARGIALVLFGTVFGAILGPAVFSPLLSGRDLDSDANPIEVGGGLLALTKPWPSMLRTIWGDPDRYVQTYFSKWPGRPDLYFPGDGAKRDDDGYYWILGRVDDVLNVAGHRIGTMEVESALVEHPAGLTHRLVDERAKAAAGVTDGLVRVSVGLEHVDEIAGPRASVRCRGSTDDGRPQPFTISTAVALGLNWLNPPPVYPGWPNCPPIPELRLLEERERLLAERLRAPLPQGDWTARASVDSSDVIVLAVQPQQITALADNGAESPSDPDAGALNVIV